MLLSIARRDNGICNPSTPTLIKARSKDGAFFVLGRFEFTQIRTEKEKEPLERSEGVLLSIARRDDEFILLFTSILLTYQSIEPWSVSDPNT